MASGRFRSGPDSSRVARELRSAIGAGRFPAGQFLPCTRDLGRRGVNLVLVEGGSEVLGSFFDAGLIDQVLVFIAPKLIGGRAAKSPLGGEGLSKMLDAAILRELKNYRLEGDVIVEGKIGSWEWAEAGKKP